MSAESPLVDVQSITTRTVMTREVMDAIPTGRNIQAVGILIPGTSLAHGGGGALSRDVGGSGGLQQSPLQYRGSGDTVQTIEGLRLNNLCAQGAYSGVYWNDGSFQEISYVTGADSAEMGQGGMRVNMVPKDGGNTFRGTCRRQFRQRQLRVGQLQFARHRPGLRAVEPLGRSHLQPEQQAHQRQPDPGHLGLQSDDRRADHARQALVQLHVPPLGREQDRWRTATPTWIPRRSATRRTSTSPGVDDGHIVSNAGRIAWQIASKDKISYYHDNQRKYRDHWGIAANVPPEAAGVQVTPTSFVSVTKWSRTHTNRLLLEGGLGIYDQNYTELYQPSVTGHRRQGVRPRGDSQRAASTPSSGPGDRQDRQRLAGAG